MKMAVKNSVSGPPFCVFSTKNYTLPKNCFFHCVLKKSIVIVMHKKIDNA